MKVNILGTEYIISKKNRDEDKRLDNADGLCDDSVKEITLAIIELEPDSKKDLDSYAKKVLRHEIVHAFLCESGLCENSYWAQNEEMADWIAIQGPKIYKAWEEAGAIDEPKAFVEVLDKKGRHTGEFMEVKQ